MGITEEKLKKEYDKYVLEKTQSFSNIVGYVGFSVFVIIALAVIFGVVMMANFIVAIVLFALGYGSLYVINFIVTSVRKANEKAVCMPYEKWASEYLKRGTTMQSYNQSESTFSNKITYDTEILPYTIRAKITELQNQIDSNEIVNRNLPMFEKLLQQRVLVTAQKQLIELEIQKIPLYQQARENQVFTALMAQKNDKQKTIDNIENQLNRLQ